MICWVLLGLVALSGSLVFFSENALAGGKTGMALLPDHRSPGLIAFMLFCGCERATRSVASLQRRRKAYGLFVPERGDQERNLSAV